MSAAAPQRLARDLTAEEVRAVVVLGNERVEAVVTERFEVEELSDHPASARYFPGMTLDFSPSPIAVPQPVLDDLRERLARTRLPNQLDGVGLEQGTELGYLETLLAYWKDTFDWRGAGSALQRVRTSTSPRSTASASTSCTTRSPEPDALPLLI